MGAAGWQPGQVESKAGQALARLRPSAKKPVWNPSITGSWDYGEVCANAEALYDWMGEGMVALAIQGDIASLREILRVPGLGVGELNRLPGSWLPEMFLVAEPSILPALIDEWIEPCIAWPRGHPTQHFSEHWGACLAAAMSRAHGDPRIVARCDAILALARPKGQGDEKCSKILSAVVEHGGVDPNDYAHFLSLSASWIHGVDPRHLATFASRLQYGFQDALDTAREAAEGSKAEGSAWDASWIGAGMGYLEWASTIDLWESDYPAVARALGMCQPFSQRVELAGSLARFCGSMGAMDGFVLEEGVIESARDVDYPFLTKTTDFWHMVGWKGRSTGPVEQALLHGRIESAKALIEAGFGFEHLMFEGLCAGILANHANIRSNKEGIDLLGIVSRALTLCASIEIDKSALPSKSKGEALRV